MKVCVIGAGFAGLAAADALRRGGADVVVLEARERVGGRVWSEELPNGAVIERGAEFIEHYHETLLGLAARLGLRLAPTGMAYGNREPRGGLGVTPPALTRAYAALMTALAARRADPDESVAAFLARAVADDAAREAIRARVEISSTQPAERVAADSLMKGGYNISLDESLRVAGGNQGLALALARELGDAVRLGAPAERIAWSDDGVRVDGAGATVETDLALLTIPARLMPALRCDPPLPEWKRRALADVDYGHAAKLFVPLRAPTSASATMAVPDRYWVWTATGADGEVQPLASCFAGSAPALDALRVADGPAVWLERLARLRPDLRLAAQDATLTAWDADPRVGASYSTTAPGRARDSGALIRPVGPLHFAGEHTAGMWSSTMEGALRSGLRAAAGILGRMAG